MWFGFSRLSQYIYSNSIFTARNRSCGKVMISEMSVSFSVHKGRSRPGSVFFLVPGPFGERGRMGTVARTKNVTSLPGAKSRSAGYHTGK